MAIPIFNFSEMSKFVGFLAPFIIIFVIIVISLFSGQPLKGGMYILGLLATSFIIIAVSHIFKTPAMKGASYACNMFSIPGITDYISPCLSSAIMSFTAIYLMGPMITANEPNPSLFAFLIIMNFLNAYTKYSSSCSDVKGIIAGFVSGAVLAAAYVGLIYASHENANSELLFLSEVLPNNEICSRPSQQEFKCRVYKNGKLIRNKSNDV